MFFGKIFKNIWDVSLISMQLNFPKGNQPFTADRLLSNITRLVRHCMHLLRVPHVLMERHHSINMGRRQTVRWLGRLLGIRRLRMPLHRHKCWRHNLVLLRLRQDPKDEGQGSPILAHAQGEFAQTQRQPGYHLGCQ